MTTAEASPRQTPYLLFMLVVSVVAIVTLAAERLLVLSPDQRVVFELFDWAVCAIFLADFVYCLLTAPNRVKYLVTWGWLDLLSAVPSVAALRLVRSVRIVRIVRVLRVLRVGRVLFRSLAERRSAAGLASLALIVLVVLLVSSVAILQVEQGPEARIATAEDAVWWSVTTMTTVGYGDLVPTTTEGRLVAGILMITGVGLFGALSGLLAAWFVAPSDTRRLEEIEALRRELKALKDSVERVSGTFEG